MRAFEPKIDRLFSLRVHPLPDSRRGRLAVVRSCCQRVVNNRLDSGATLLAPYKRKATGQHFSAANTNTIAILAAAPLRLSLPISLPTGTRTLALQKLHRICLSEVRTLKARYTLATVSSPSPSTGSAIPPSSPDHLVLRPRKCVPVSASVISRWIQKKPA